MRATFIIVLLMVSSLGFVGCKKHRTGSLPGTWKGAQKADHVMTFNEDGTYTEHGNAFGFVMDISGTYTYAKGTLKLVPTEVTAPSLKPAMTDGLKTPRELTIDFVSPDRFVDPDGISDGKDKTGEQFDRQ
jgi:hypothetical protein